MSNSTNFQLPIFIACLFFLFCRPSLSRAQEAQTALSIEHPYEGETIYAGPSTPRYNLPISGWVSLGNLNHEQVELYLEVFQENLLIGSISTQPSSDGQFIFYAQVNPFSSDLELPLGGDCGENCHFPVNVEVDINLPQGDVLLRVSAFDHGELISLAERNIVVDRSKLVKVPVEIYFSELTKVVEGVRISGSTRLYLWRARHFSTVSGLDGKALIEVESLSEGPAHYIFEIEPTVIGGLLYEGIEPVEMILPAGATSIPSVTLEAKATAGQITGRVNSPQKNLIPSFPIWAIHLPDGNSYQNTISPDKSVTFSELPIGQYLLAANNRALVDEGCQLEAQLVDLTSSPHASVDFSLSPTTGTSMAGEVLDSEGLPLPFAWVMMEVMKISRAVLPDTGAFWLSGLPSKPLDVIASAPGYYSQAYPIQPGSPKPTSIFLLPRPETRFFQWGDGEIVLPPETSVRVDGNRMKFERGWLWGQGGEAQALVIDMAESEIEIPAGRFALEKMPGKTSWFYLLDGNAVIHWGSAKEKIFVDAGQMVALVGHPVPVSYEQVAVTALNYPDTESPLPVTWPPTLRAKIQNRLTRVGIGTAQLVTFITYLMVVISVVIGPFIGLYWWRRHHRKNNIRFGR